MKVTYCDKCCRYRQPHEPMLFTLSVRQGDTPAMDADICAKCLKETFAWFVGGWIPPRTVNAGYRVDADSAEQQRDDLEANR